jgi:hypothetical protein
MLKPGDPPPPPPSGPQQFNNIVYHDNAGYHLTVSNLPWGKSWFKLKRYRISKTQNLELIEEKTSVGDTVKLDNAMPTDTIELIVLERQ